MSPDPEKSPSAEDANLGPCSAWHLPPPSQPTTSSEDSLPTKPSEVDSRPADLESLPTSPSLLPLYHRSTGEINYNTFATLPRADQALVQLNTCVCEFFPSRHRRRFRGVEGRYSVAETVMGVWRVLVLTAILIGVFLGFGAWWRSWGFE